MVDKEFIGYFKLAHGSFNLCLLCLFCYQGWMGLRIRTARLDASPLPFILVRRHRILGPVLALWGLLGFVSGLTMMLLDKSRVLEYPLHFATGAVVVAVIGALTAVSRRIGRSALPVRDVHFGLGMTLLGLMIIQCFLGLSILF
jgi:hypothetical protein